MKKLISLVLALCMVLMVGAAFAEGDPAPVADGTFLGSNPETTISVSDLLSGDGAVYFPLISRNTTTGQWELVANYGVTLEELVNGVTSVEAATIANAIKTAGLTGTAMTVSSGTASATVDPGMYYVFVTPGTTNDVIYNPIFVSADYYQGGNTISATAAYSDKVIAKKQPVDLTKTMDNAADKDVKIGQDVPFTVTTHIPSYTDAYSSKVFTLTDTLDSGLTLNTGSVTVTVAGDADLASPADYTVTETTNGAGYTVTFTDAYLDGMVGNPLVTITYTAKVTTSAITNVTEFDNKVELEYTHNVDGTTKEITKKTRHYTFSIDAKLLGSTGDETITEDFIKVAVDGNGDPVYVTDQSTQRTIDSNVTVAALRGAVFELKGVTDTSVSKTITTNEKGEISAYGLDAGIYTLHEVSAPAGFIKDDTTYYVEIAPTYTNDAEGVPYLVSYAIRFATTQAALETSTVKSYTMTNDSNTHTVTKIEGKDITGNDTRIRNTQGASLPSTGGIGTTIFYIVGGLLVVGAAVVMVARRKASN